MMSSSTAVAAGSLPMMPTQDEMMAMTPPMPYSSCQFNNHDDATEAQTVSSGLMILPPQSQLFNGDEDELCRINSRYYDEPAAVIRSDDNYSCYSSNRIPRLTASGAFPYPPLRTTICPNPIGGVKFASECGDGDKKKEKCKTKKFLHQSKIVNCKFITLKGLLPLNS